MMPSLDHWVQADCVVDSSLTQYFESLSYWKAIESKIEVGSRLYKQK